VAVLSGAAKARLEQQGALQKPLDDSKFHGCTLPELHLQSNVLSKKFIEYAIYLSAGSGCNRLLAVFGGHEGKILSWVSPLLIKQQEASSEKSNYVSDTLKTIPLRDVLHKKQQFLQEI
jgi:hypothetical protein